MSSKSDAKEKHNDEKKTPQTQYVPGARLLVLNSSGTYESGRLLRKMDDGSICVDIFDFGPRMKRIPFDQLNQTPLGVKFDPEYSVEDIVTYPLPKEMQELADTLIQEKNYVELAMNYLFGVNKFAGSFLTVRGKQTFIIDTDKTMKYLLLAFKAIDDINSAEDKRIIQNEYSINAFYKGCEAAFYLGEIYSRCFKDYIKAEKCFVTVVVAVPYLVSGLNILVGPTLTMFRGIGYHCAFGAQFLMSVNGNHFDNCEEKEIYYIRQCLTFQFDDPKALANLAVCLLKQKCSTLENEKIMEYEVSNEIKNEMKNKDEKKNDDNNGDDSGDEKIDIQVTVDNTYCEAFHCLRNAYHQNKEKGPNQCLSLCYFMGLGCKANFEKCNDIHLKYADGVETYAYLASPDMKSNENRSQCSKLWLTIQSIVLPNGFENKKRDMTCHNSENVLESKESNENLQNKNNARWQHPLRDEIYDKLMDCMHNHFDANLFYGNFLRIIEFQVFENDIDNKQRNKKADCMLISLLIVIRLYGFLEMNKYDYKQFKSFLFDKCFKHPSVVSIVGSESDVYMPHHLIWLAEWMYGFFECRTQAIEQFNVNMVDPITALIYEYELAIILNENDN